MVPNFNRLAGPLIAMTKLTAGWKSGPLPQEALQSFANMKQALSSQPVIAHSRTGGQYILTVDAATTGLRGNPLTSQSRRGNHCFILEQDGTQSLMQLHTLHARNDNGVFRPGTLPQEHIWQESHNPH